MPGETVRGRQENRSTSIIKAGDRERERWCLLLINIWSDIKEGTVNLTVKLANLRGMTIIWLRHAGNNWISHVALYAVGVPKPVHGPHRALRVVKRAVRAPIYSGQCHHQAFLPTYNHPVAVSLTYHISGWEPVAHFLIHSRPHWLALPQGGWHACQALIFMLNVFSFASRFWFYGSENSFILTTGSMGESRSRFQRFLEI